MLRKRDELNVRRWGIDKGMLCLMGMEWKGVGWRGIWLMGGLGRRVRWGIGRRVLVMVREFFWWGGRRKGRVRGRKNRIRCVLIFVVVGGYLQEKGGGMIGR